MINILVTRQTGERDGIILSIMQSGSRKASHEYIIPFCFCFFSYNLNQNESCICCGDKAEFIEFIFH